MLGMKLDYLSGLGERVRELNQKGLTETEIAARLPGRDWLWRLGTREHFSKRNFVRAFLSSLPLPPTRLFPVL